MEIRLSRRLVLLSLVVVALAAPSFARGKKSPAPTQPGSYKDWGADIDEIEILKTFKFSDYSRVVVEPMNTSALDTTNKAIEKVAANATSDFVEELKKQVKTSVEMVETSKKSAGTLVIRTKAVSMDPGSRAKRYMASFGAGAAIAKIDGEIVDAKTNQVLARFTQERRSGFGVAGGNSESLLRRDIRAIAVDVANILNAF